MAKSEPRQIPMGKCGHKIQRVKIGKRLEWRCLEGCESAAQFDHNKLAPRGKAK